MRQPVPYSLSSAVVIVTRWGRLYLATATVNPSLANLLATAAPGSGIVTRVFLLETRRNSFVSTIRICASLCPFWDSLCSPILPVHLCPWDQCWGLVLTKRSFETMLFCTMYDIGSVNTAHVLWSRFPHQTDRQSKTDKKLSWDLLLFESEVVSFGIWNIVFSKFDIEVTYPRPRASYKCHPSNSHPISRPHSGTAFFVFSNKLSSHCQFQQKTQERGRWMLHKSLQLVVIGKLLTECKKRRPRPKGRFLRDKFSHNSSLPKNGFSTAKDTEQVFSQLQFHQRRCSIAQLSRPERNPDSDVSMLLFSVLTIWINCNRDRKESLF